MTNSARIFSAIRVSVVVMVFSLLNSAVVFANSAPSPSVIWLRFEYKTKQPIRMVGMQLIGCQSKECQNPVLLQQYKTCDEGLCLSTRPEDDTGWNDSFECLGNKCRLSSDNYGERLFRLIIQFSDKTRVGDVMARLPPNYLGEQSWRIDVHEQALVVTQETIAPDIGLGDIVTRLLVSIAIEIVVAGAYLALWLKTNVQMLSKQLLAVFWINLGTWPIVWLVFPSLDQFQVISLRVFGVLSLLCVLVYLGGLIGIYASANWHQRLIRITLVSIVVVVGVAFSLLTTIAVSYGNRDAIAFGLPPNMSIAIAEMLVVIVEAVLFIILSRKALSWKQASTMSLFINMASFLLGQVQILVALHSWP